MELQQELKTAKKAAREAGRCMGEYQERELEVNHKSSQQDPVTEADLECQKAIIDIIESDFPEDEFLAEEEGLKPEEGDRVWIIDPIDGTGNYSHGFPWYCSSIALQIDGETELGVVYSIFNDEMFEAIKDEGAKLNGERIKVSDIENSQEALFLAIQASVWASGWVGEMHEEEGSYLEALLEAPIKFRWCGSIALEMCQVAAGRAEGFSVPAAKIWDLAASKLILEEAGGTVRVQKSVRGDFLEVLASNGKLQEEFEKIFDENIRR